MPHRRVAGISLFVLGAFLPSRDHGIAEEPLPCVRSDPVECPGDGGPVFRLGFRGPCGAPGEAGSVEEIALLGTIETHCLEAGSGGTGGWTLSIVMEGCKPVGATTRGTAAALATEGGFRNPDSSFEKTALVDPARNAGKMGVVSGVALDLEGLVTLPPAGSPHDVIVLTLEGTIPEDCGECIIRHEDGLAGTGEPVRNSLTYRDKVYAPALAEMRIELCSTDAGGLQKPGDENQDGDFNLSDPISVLNHLFSGTNPTLPCGDGTTGDPANLAILDLNGNGAIDLSDPIHALNFLFGGGPPPEMGEECLRVRGCPTACGT